LRPKRGLKAIANAGLNAQDIDGLLSNFHKRPGSQEVRELTQTLGIKHCNFQLYSDGDIQARFFGRILIWNTKIHHGGNKPCPAHSTIFA
jgi:hypothetical protein